jgi:hypothetical protein
MPSGADIGRLIEAAEKALDCLMAFELGYPATNPREESAELVAALARIKGADPRAVRRQSFERVESQSRQDIDDWSAWPEFNRCDRCGAGGEQLVDTGSKLFPFYECYPCIDRRADQINEQEMWRGHGRPNFGRRS